MKRRLFEGCPVTAFYHDLRPEAVARHVAVWQLPPAAAADTPTPVPARVLTPPARAPSLAQGSGGDE